MPTDNLLLAEALKACRELAIKIPGDVALADFDEITWATLVQPAPIVISQPADEIGRAAMVQLLRRLQKSDQPFRQVILKGQLLVRESTKPGYRPAN
jgi:LacI family fructose operon transcriptional repressor